MAEHAPTVLQKAWNDMINEFNKIFAELEWVRPFSKKKSVERSLRGSPHEGEKKERAKEGR